jgi:simple sugar transport system ATP-binding protein
MTTPLLTLNSLSKAYPGVIANQDVSFEIMPGEIHALLGENGAGKSTLVKTIYGLVTPDSGEMTLLGAPYTPAAPHAARSAGVAMVFQHFSLFDALNVAENIALGMETPPPLRAIADQVRAVSAKYGLPLDPDRIVGDLSAGERQRVEIIRCLLQDPKLLIMDEPTSVLTPKEVTMLFETLRKLAQEGTAILYISHKLEEIRSLCETATVLRLGAVVGSCDPRETSARDMAELMVGAKLATPQKRDTAVGAIRFRLNDLSATAPHRFGTALKTVNLSVRAGEIYGIGGVAGNGQDELVAALSGEMKTAANMVVLNGDPVGHLNPNNRRARGFCAAPEERNGHAAAPDMTLIENTALTAVTREGLSNRGFLRWDKAQSLCEKIIATFDVRTPSAANTARSLSGGNLQKFVIGREILQSPDVFVVNQPPWGVDAAAAAAIRQALLDLATKGAAVIVISQDLDELMEISDYFAALNGGHLSDPQPMQELTIDQIGLMLGGADITEAQKAG